MGAQYGFIHILHRFVLHVLCPSCFAVCGHPITSSVATVFSLLSSVPISSCHICLFSSFPPLTQSVPPCTFDVLSLCEFYSIALPQGHICTSSSSPPHEWYTSVFFPAGPGPLHEIAVSAFSRSPLGRANTFSFLFLLLTPWKSPSVPPLSRRFLALTFPSF